MMRKTYHCFSFLLCLCLFSAAAIAQPTWTFDPFGKEKKPVEYEEKKLGSEKTADKKFTKFRRFTQNNITHYNYYFNANNKVNTVVERAVAAQQDEYSQLLPFYAFTMDNTASQSGDLDSVIYKSTAGILLHDLRTDWVDNMYLLIGKAYFYKKAYDSATLTFQFINYNLFPRKKNEDDNRIVGANNTAASSKLTIADKEKRNIFQRMFSLPPSRNDALIWLARTYIEMDQYGEAAGMINILQDDPNLPKRLKPSLDQITSYWYYKQNAYDSAAKYLESGLSSAPTKYEKARWQFLLGQLYELSGNYNKADGFYAYAAKNTVNPLMDIYARLNKAKMLRNSGNLKELDKSIATLLQMAKRDKYETYRDIIFHSAAQLSLQKPDTAAAIGFFKSSLKANENNLPFKNKAHLQLGRIAYQQKNYKAAADHYDSLDITEKLLLKDSAEVVDRKATLRKISNQIFIIENEDSLQMVAALPPAERDAFIKKLVKQLNKEKDSKSSDNKNNTGGGGLSSSFDNGKDNAGIDLFATSTKGEWYFYNSGMKSRGFNEFNAKWGKRENLDNWRRKSALDMAGMGLDGPGAVDPLAPIDSSKIAIEGGLVANSYDALFANLPTTQEKLDSSNIKVANAMLELAELFQNELQDYPQAIYTYEMYLQRYPAMLAEGKAHLGLYYCYNKIGDTEKAAFYKNLLDTQFADTKAAKMINDPLSLQPDKNNPVVSQKYATIYDLFLQGNFDTAFALKKIADSLYGKNYWSPQLLYIEALYYIKCTQDSAAIATLENLIQLYPNAALKSKSENLIEVLKRRKEIESYLTNLEITRVEDDERILIANDKNIETKKAIVVAPTAPKIPAIKNIPVVKDSGIQLPPSMVSGAFKWKASQTHVAVMVLNKVDAVYANETKNAFKRFNSSNGFSNVVVNRDTLSSQMSLMVFGIFISAADAFAYCSKIKKAAPTQISWLPANRYSFIIISEENLSLLKSNKDLDGYKKLLDNQYPGQF
jgi:tetratricopeptide (TPR) repeat protein